MAQQLSEGPSLAHASVPALKFDFRELSAAWNAETSDAVADTRIIRPRAAQAATTRSLCFRQPVKVASTVVGMTSASIHKWKFSFAQNVTPMIGMVISNNGVTRQWMPQAIAISIAARSSQVLSCGVHFVTSVGDIFMKK